MISASLALGKKEFSCQAFPEEKIIEGEMRLKPLAFGFLILITTHSTSLAQIVGDEDPESKLHAKWYEYSGYRLDHSQLKDPGYFAFSQGPAIGVRYKIMQNGYFFAPDLELAMILGLEPSPAPMFALGFTAGGQVFHSDFEVYFGVQKRRIIYIVDSLWSGRLGASYEILKGDLRFYFEMNIGKFVLPQVSDVKTYTLYGFAFGAQIPI